MQETQARTTRKRTDRMDAEAYASRKSKRLSSLYESTVESMLDNAMRPKEVNLYETWTKPSSYAFYVPNNRYHAQLKELLMEAKLSDDMVPTVTYNPQVGSIPERLAFDFEFVFDKATVPGSDTLFKSNQKKQGTLDDMEEVLQLDALNLANAVRCTMSISFPVNSGGQTHTVVRGFKDVSEKRVHFMHPSLLDELHELMRCSAVLAQDHGLTTPVSPRGPRVQWQLETKGSMIVLQYKDVVHAPQCEREMNIKKKKIMDPCIDTPLKKFVHTPISTYLFMVSMNSVYKQVASYVLMIKGVERGSTSTGKKRGTESINNSSTVKGKRSRESNAEFAAKFRDQQRRLESLAEDDEANALTIVNANAMANAMANARANVNTVADQDLGTRTKADKSRKKQKQMDALVAEYRARNSRLIENADSYSNELAYYEDQGMVKVPGSVIRGLAKKNLLESVVDTKKDPKTGRIDTRIYDADALPTRFQHDKMYSVNFDLGNRDALERELVAAQCELEESGDVKAYVKCKAIRDTLKNAANINTLARDISKVKINSNR